ncbi:MAG: hypothetical protein MJ223_03085 [Mycoplasmoidaceae bacterium]|nr:hypothetical protein [Mycoplasmoidaceae bacterium]
MTLRQKSYFYRRLISTAALLRRIKLELKVAKKDLLSQIDEMIKNLKESNFSSEQTKEEE